MYDYINCISSYTFPCSYNRCGTCEYHLVTGLCKKFHSIGWQVTHNAIVRNDVRPLLDLFVYFPLLSVLKDSILLEHINYCRLSCKTLEILFEIFVFIEIFSSYDILIVSVLFLTSVLLHEMGRSIKI